MKTNKILSLLLCGAAFAQLGVAEDIIYSNTPSPLVGGTSLNYFGNSLVAAGNQITFGGTSRFLTSAAMQVFNSSVTDVTGSSATLNLYTAGAASLLGTYTLTPVTFTGAALTTVTFSLPYLLVPNTIIWTLAFDPSLELNYYNGPGVGDVGSADGTNAWWNTGTGPVSTSFPAGGEIYFATFGAEAQTPEPATWALMAGGLLVVAHRRRSA